MLEIACFNAASAIAAVRAGADRIELCADYSAGGITPSLPTLLAIQDELDFTNIEESLTGEGTPRDKRVPINVMIRPRGGDFNYSAVEFETMKRYLQSFKTSSVVDGFVFGILAANKRVDEERNRQLVELAAPLPCTFHRAIDEVDDLDAAVETIIECGFKSILTSGGKKSAREGANEVARLQEKYGDRIHLILGGGIRSSNAVDLKSETGLGWVHSAAITREGEMVDEEEVRSMVTLLKEA